MKERYLLVVLIIFVFMLILDFYSFKGLKTITFDFSNAQTRHTVHIIYWSMSILFILPIPVFFFFSDYFVDPKNNSTAFLMNSVIFTYVLAKLTFVIFHGLDDILNLFRRIFEAVFQSSSSSDLQGSAITRLNFLTYLGAAAFVLTASAFTYGIVKGRFNFRIIAEKLKFKNLPSKFNGFKVIQISDLHIGSFSRFHKSVEDIIEKINNLNPDLIVFTGDMVNNVADEMEGWQPIFSRLKAKHGKISILGNHDYGDYHTFPSAQAKIDNLNRLKEIHREIGFDLLLNENRTIKIDNDQISILGVENWGNPPFVQYGDLDLASKGTENAAFKLLLSHDPSHWDEQVKPNTNIDLTLSGHTHGMQFGIEIPGFKWSPVKYKYPKWAGLYSEGNQHLYVNRGFGHLGFAGRVGMDPEITEIELLSA
jgi:predicted MPP superfamily phosphohydrolase